MPIIIDGHNLIPNIPGMNLSTIDDEDQLIEILQEFQRHVRKDIEVFFDNAPPGLPSTQKYGAVTAHYIRKGHTADQAIHARLRNLGKSARNWTVVSSDREVVNMAKSMRARIISSKKFALGLSKSPKLGGRGSERHTEKVIQEKLSLREVEKWLKLFGE